MPRQARLFIADQPIFARQVSHSNAVVFRAKEDFDFYREQVGDLVGTLALKLHAYCLLPDSASFVLTIDSKQNLSRLFQSLGRRYVRYFNRKYGSQGSIWSGRFQSCTFDSKHYLLRTIGVIESIPRLTEPDLSPELYPFSSAGFHTGLRMDPLVSLHSQLWSLGNTPFERQANHRALISEGPDHALWNRLLQCAKNGWHLAPAGQFEQLTAGNAVLAGRRNQPGRRGRPPKPVTR